MKSLVVVLMFFSLNVNAQVFFGLGSGVLNDKREEGIGYHYLRGGYKSKGDKIDLIFSGELAINRNVNQGGVILEVSKSVGIIDFLMGTVVDRVFNDVWYEKNRVSVLGGVSVGFEWLKFDLGIKSALNGFKRDVLITDNQGIKIGSEREVYKDFALVVGVSYYLSK